MDPPNGFEPINSYRTGQPVPIPGLARLEVSPRVGYTFDISRGAPALPLKAFGEISKYKVPFRYAVDAAGITWMDEAENSPLRIVPHTDLLLVAGAKDEHTENQLRAILGLPPKVPAWITQARKHGWTPPPGWVDP